MVNTVCSGEMQASAPTRRMSRSSSGCSGVPRTDSRTRARPLRRYRPRKAAPQPKAMTWPAATPAMPSRGNGPQPRPSAPPHSTWASATSRKVAAGTAMLPEPRSTDAKVFISQTPMDPTKATFEYATASASAAPRPPRPA